MRNPNRLDAFYDEFRELHKEHFPDWRFSQLMINFFGFIGRDPWYYEEDKIMELFRSFCKNNGVKL